jgi:fluoride exporter
MRENDGMGDVVSIGLGGVLGANARYIVAVWAADRYGTGFPYGTFLINAMGSLAMGLVSTLLGSAFPAARLFLTTGFLGAYTTFSTFTYESIALLRQGEIKMALVNVLGSAGSGIAGCALGVALGQQVAGWIR